MKSHYLKALAFSVSAGLCMTLTAQSYYAGVSPELGAGELRTLDAPSGTSTNTTPITLNGNSIDGITGMAHNQADGMTYVTYKEGGDIHLATIDLSNGNLSLISTLDEKFASLAITPTGTAYGITGDGANTPETIYEIDLSDGSLTLNTQPGTGFDGEALAYNTNDGLLYRYGGGQVFQSIDPLTSNVINIFLTHEPSNWAHSLTYDELTDSFLFTAEDSIFSVSDVGIMTPLAELDNENGYKGLVSTNVTGIEEGLEEVSLHAYPNPAENVITLSGLGSELWQHELIDPLGRVVMTTSTSTDQATIDLSELRSGHYAVVSRSERKKAVTPFVIQ